MAGYARVYNWHAPTDSEADADDVDRITLTEPVGTEPRVNINLYREDDGQKITLDISEGGAAFLHNVLMRWLRIKQRERVGQN